MHDSPFYDKIPAILREPLKTEIFSNIPVLFKRGEFI